MDICKEFKIHYNIRTRVFFILVISQILAYCVINPLVQETYTAIAFALSGVIFTISAIIGYIYSYKKVVLSCKNDILNIKFIKKNYTKEYNIYLLDVLEYKEIYINNGCGKLVFLNSYSTIEIPYSFFYQDIRKEILAILQNYKFKKTLVSRF